MIAQKRSLKKITMTAGIVAMTVGLINSFSFEANAASTTGGTKAALVRNCTADGEVYAYATYCGSGTGKCVEKQCPDAP